MKFVGSESPPEVGHFACGGFPFQGSILHATDISPSGGSISHAAGISPSSGSISHAAHSLPGGAFSHAAVARRGSIHSCEGHFPSSRSSPPATQITVGCGDVFRYWRGDGCCGIGYETLCRFIPILHNFFSGNYLLPSNHKETQPFLPAIQRSADGSTTFKFNKKRDCTPMQPLNVIDTVFR